jgi:hypothetical protein
MNLRSASGIRRIFINAMFTVLVAVVFQGSAFILFGQSMAYRGRTGSASEPDRIARR